MNTLKTEYIVISIAMTIAGIWLYNYIQSNDTRNTIEQLTMDDEIIVPESRQFYSSMSGLNKDLRPSGKRYLKEDIIPDEYYPIISKLKYNFGSALKHFPLTFTKQPKLVFANSDVEAGMPHTLGNSVIFPLQKSILSRSDDDVWSTMTHELCHVHQRQFTEQWIELYRQLGFKRISDTYIITSIPVNKMVMNPDVNGSSQLGWWEYKGQLGALIFNSKPNNIRDHNSVVFPVKDDYETTDKNILREDFGELVKQYDHPNEITACLLADHWDSIVRPLHNTTITDDDPRMIMRKWIQTINSK